MGNTSLTDVVDWLKSEIKRQQGLIASMEDGQKELGPQIDALKSKQKTLEESLAKAKEELRQAIENAKNAQREAAETLQAVHEKLAERQKTYEAVQKDKESLGCQLSEAQRQSEPILQEIETLKNNIKQLNAEIDAKKHLVETNTALPEEINKLRGRCERALGLRPGFLQKTAIAEELLHKNASLKESIGTTKLEEYKRLCTELQSMSFDEKQEMGDEQ